MNEHKGQCPQDTMGQNSQAMCELKQDKIPAWRREVPALVKELLGIGSCWERESQVFFKNVVMGGSATLQWKATHP